MQAYSVVFFLLGVMFALYAQMTPYLLLKGILGWLIFSSLGMGFAYLLNRPELFQKRLNGSLSPSSYVLYGPFHLMNHLLLALYRKFEGEPAYTEIQPRLYLGRRPYAREGTIIQRLNLRGVVDLTCEFAEAQPFRDASTYLCLPLLDTQAPTSLQLAEISEWIATHLEDGSVLVHCALGHGRSATVVAAYLLYSGSAASAQEAIDRVTALRPKASLSRLQRDALHEFERHLSVQTEAARKHPSA